MKLDFSEFLWDPFYKVRNVVPVLFASAMMSMMVMILIAEMILEDIVFRLWNDADTGADNVGYTDAEKWCWWWY